MTEVQGCVLDLGAQASELPAAVRKLLAVQMWWVTEKQA